MRSIYARCFYDSIRYKTEEYAELIVLDILRAGVILRDDFDLAFWKEVGRLKAVHKASLADLCGLELARRLGGMFLTADHHEFDTILETEGFPISFIR
jgi:hypothetical protein